MVRKYRIGISFTPPVGKYKAWITFPIFFPKDSEVKLAISTTRLISEKKQKGSGYNYVILPLEHNSLDQTTYKVTLTLSQLDPSQSFIIHPHFVAYGGLSLAYRLSILDVRFIVVNRLYHKSTTNNYANSKYIRKLYQFRTSVLYENLLNQPRIFPKKTYLIDQRQPWRLFNNKISHHPNYQPHNASFCFEGSKQEFDGIVNGSDWQEEAVPQFIEEYKSVNKGKLVGLASEKIEFEINCQEPGFAFFAFRYHPNLVAYINGRETKTYLGQAGNIAIKIPTGNLHVTIQYKYPWYDILGKWISLISIITIFAYILSNLRKKTQ